MAQFLTPGIQQLETSAGSPLSGGKCHVYAVSTTTPLALFSDETLSTPAANPLVADSSGSFPSVFLSETKAKLVIVTSTDAPFDTRQVIYTTGVASAVPATGVSYDGSTSGLASNDVQSAIDEVVELQSLGQSWAISSDGVIVTATSTNAGATAGPDFDLYRDSASPAASDLLGGFQFNGKNAAASKTRYGYVRGVITDPTNGSEDGKVVIGTMVAGAEAARVNVGAGLFSEGVSDPGTGKANFSEVQQSGAGIRPLVTGTAQASTSGTAVSFSSIPSWATRITVLFQGVSLNGSDDIMVQIGDSGGIETTGYVSTGGTFYDADQTDTVGSTTAYIVNVDGQVLSGAMTITKITGNVWVSNHTFGASNGRICLGGGAKTLSDVLDRLMITRTGSNSFNAGQVNITYE